MARLAASSMVTPQYRPSPRSLVGASLVLLVAALVFTVTPVLAKNSLRNGSVGPRSGTTSTIFAFRVDSVGKPSPTSITARLTRGGAAPISIALTAPPSGQTWSRSARVRSAGTWTVTFIASTGASAPGGSITVTVPPTPTSKPTPKPPAATTPSPSPRRSPAASPFRSPRSSPSARPTPTGRPPSTPTAVGGATQPSSSPGTGAGGVADQSGPLLPAIVLGLFVILGVGGIALLTGRRQAEERPS